MRSFIHIYFALAFVLLTGSWNFLGGTGSTGPMVPLANAAIIPRRTMNVRSLKLARLDPHYFSHSERHAEARAEDEDIQARTYNVVAASSDPESVHPRGDEEGGHRRSPKNVYGHGHGDVRPRGRRIVYRRVHPRDFRMKRFVMEE
ncbi:hypothetical protein P691DRAFT_811908 [Macrolepiota fuliginosa MF-IS2]|uniref:Uncharacterized protein n=1 Tax=Macrolepiota fuliginosa MF-IS2 TaxID=1400762 RepID=A0A9P5XIB8_9AGAR|nr:hypothetical protein P691DRAFT_811908 [Macrolepiota fuliginosa MF-IS2]